LRLIRPCAWRQGSGRGPHEPVGIEHRARYDLRRDGERDRHNDPRRDGERRWTGSPHIDLRVSWHRHERFQPRRTERGTGPLGVLGSDGHRSLRLRAARPLKREGDLPSAAQKGSRRHRRCRPGGIGGHHWSSFSGGGFASPAKCPPGRTLEIAFRTGCDELGEASKGGCPGVAQATKHGCPVDTSIYIRLLALNRERVPRSWGGSVPRPT
jgi:hypothetical protein